MRVKIFQLIKSPTQSAPIADKKWKMEFEQEEGAMFIEDVTARTSSSDMNQQIELFFPTLEKAIEYAKRNDYDYEVLPTKSSRIIPKSYASNFQ